MKNVFLEQFQVSYVINLFFELSQVKTYLDSIKTDKVEFEKDIKKALNVCRNEQVM